MGVSLMPKLIICLVLSIMLCVCGGSAVCPLAECFAARAESGFVATNGSVNLRSGPGLSYDTVGSVSGGVQLAYAGEQSEDGRGIFWYKVHFDADTDAWVSSKYAVLEMAAEDVDQSNSVPESGAAFEAAVIMMKDVNVRTGPNTECDIIRVARAGTTLIYAGKRVMDRRGVTWYAVEIDGYDSAWVSSTYATHSDDQVVRMGSETYAPSLNEALTDLPRGQVVSREDIIDHYGVFNFNEQINLTGASVGQSDALQHIRVSFAGGVYYGGSSGYAEDWMVGDGILAEEHCDLDGDGKKEYIILYVDSQAMQDEKYRCGDIEQAWKIAIFEPSGEGYVFATSFNVDMDWLSDGNVRSIRLVKGEKGYRILQGLVSHLDGGTATIDCVFYGYNGDEAYIDLMIDAYTGSSCFIFTGTIRPEQRDDVYEICEYYDHHLDEARAIGIVKGETLIRPLAEIEDMPLMNEEGLIRREFLGGIDAAQPVAAAYGCKLGYEFYMDKENCEQYSISLDGGRILMQMTETLEYQTVEDDEGYEIDEIEISYASIDLCSTLDHFENPYL